MDTNRSNGIATDNRIGSVAASPVRSDLVSASDARIAAARAALSGAAITPPARLLETQFTPVDGAAPVAPLALSTTAPPAPSARELAALAADVYAPGQALPSGWTIASPEQLAAIGLTENMLSSPQSEFRAEVYVREIGGQPSYVVAFRGSQSASDWGANIKQGIGLRTDHYNRALEIGERLIVPAGARVTLTGHSLGGGLASAASLAAELPASTFNAAGLSDRTLAQARTIAGADGRVDVPDISAFHVRGEILSTLQDGGDRVLGILLRAGFLDLPEAVGTRVPLDPVRPDGLRWYQDTPVARHMMDYVIASLPRS
jgi:hypothetical protein